MKFDIFTISLLLSAALIVIFFVAKSATDPKIALYLAVFTAPITRSLGTGAFLQRLTISEIMGIFFILSWAMNTLFSRRRRLQLPSPLDPYVRLLVCVLGVSLLVNLASYGDVIDGVEEFTVIFYLATFYFVFTRAVTTDEEIQRVLDIWLIATAIVVGIGLWDSVVYRLFGLPQIIGAVKENDQYRIASTFRTTGQLGVYLLSSFFVVLACYFLPGSSRRKRVGLIALMVGTIVLSFFTSRRSAYAGFLVGLAAFMVLNIKSPKIVFTALVICVAGLIGVMGFLNEADEDFSQYFLQRSMVLTPEGYQASAGKKKFMDSQWQGIFDAFTENPLIGVGTGAFQESKYNLTSNEAHSTYGQLLAETGIVGLISYALMMFVLLRLSYETGFRLKDPKWSVFCSIICAAFLGFGVSYFYNRHLRERAFWILVGLIVCMHRLAKARLQSVQTGRQRPAYPPVAGSARAADLTVEVGAR